MKEEIYHNFEPEETTILTVFENLSIELTATLVKIPADFCWKIPADFCWK